MNDFYNQVVIIKGFFSALLETTVTVITQADLITTTSVGGLNSPTYVNLQNISTSSITISNQIGTFPNMKFKSMLVDTNENLILV